MRSNEETKAIRRIRVKHNCQNATLTHSLTAALDHLRVVASSSSNDYGLRSGQHQQTDQCLLFFHLLQPCSSWTTRRTLPVSSGGVPVWASIDSCSACEAGVFSDRRQMWPNTCNEWRLSAMTVVSFSHWLLRWIPCLVIPSSWYQGYDAVPAYEKTGSCHCLLYALSTYQSQTLPTAQERSKQGICRLQ